jgi:hypothetical protein
MTMAAQIPRYKSGLLISRLRPGYFCSKMSKGKAAVAFAAGFRWPAGYIERGKVFGAASYL